MTPGDKPPQRLRLRSELALVHEEGACLPLRSTYGGCRACAAACPVGALEVSVERVALSESCTGCGRCTAACPTQALGLPELAVLEAPPAAPTATPSAPAPAAPLRLECRMVPPQAHRGDMRVLPCLGALTVGHLLAQAAAGVDVTVVDRGWCEGCACQGSEAAPGHPAQAVLEQAAAWLEAAGSPRRPTRVQAPLPLSLRPATLPEAPAPAPEVDRRRFFRAAIDKPAGRQRTAASPMGGDGRAAHPADARHPSPERERQRLALLVLARGHGREVPAEFYPQLHADARCCDRRMCVALCPTGALAAADDGAAAHLQWSADACIACGTCVRACPEQALVLAPHGGRAGRHTLASHLRLRCADCGDAFTPAAPADAGEAPALCPTCTKTRRFVADARRQLFGGTHRPPHETKETPPWA